MKLLSKGTTNAKTAKNELTTFILYLAPGKQNSKKINLCPKASPGCLQACLFTAGRGAFDNVKNARINKTEFMLNDRKNFYLQLAKEIQNKVKYYARKGQKIAFRLNGTSDAAHVKQLNIFADLWPSNIAETAIFYDYTAILSKALKYKNNPNYIVTFSRKENNWNECITALQNGVNVSAVFANELPKTYKGFKVIDGDKADDIMLKHKGVILGLRAKGKAKKDKSGFVIQDYKI